MSAPSATFNVATGQDGRYRFDRLAAGTYRVKASLGNPMHGMSFVSEQVTILADQTASLDLELVGAEAHAFRDPAGDDHHAQSRAPQEVHAEAVLDIVALELVCDVADAAQIDATVREHAVDVEADKPDAPSDFGRDHLGVAFQTDTAD